MKLSRLRAVLWDVDGTLADTHSLIHRCVDETFREFFAMSFDFELWKQTVGRPLDVVLRLGFETYGVTCADTAPLVRFYRERLKSNECHVKPFAGAPEAVRELRQRGMRQGVVTTKFGEACARHMRTLGIEDCFESVVTGDQCDRHKPDPQPFHLALKALGLEPDNCIMVGDSAADVVGARAAGIQTIAALWGTLDIAAMQASQPAFRAQHPGDVLTIIGA